MPDRGNGYNGFGGLARQIRPEVERPNFANQVVRPILLAFAMLIIAALVGACSIVWAWLLGDLAGVYVVGAVALLLLLAQGIPALSVAAPLPQLKPLMVENKRWFLYLLGYGAILLVMRLAQLWPEGLLEDPSTNVILSVQPFGYTLFAGYRWVYSGGRFWFGVEGRQLLEWVWLAWVRVMLAAAIPFSVPRITALIWRRFSVEIVYPSWKDSVTAQGRQFTDPMGLLDIHGPLVIDAQTVTAQPLPRPGGEL